jgi:hypothetical protein
VACLVCLCNSLTIFKHVWILLLYNQVVQQFEAGVDMLASCSTTSPVHHWFSHLSHLLSKMSHTTTNEESLLQALQLPIFERFWSSQRIFSTNCDPGCS